MSISPDFTSQGISAISRKWHGFTIVELLVVITIVVVLLALLAPALDKVTYQAELAICGTNLKAIGGGAITYTGTFRRSYPYRGVVNRSNTNFQAEYIRFGGPPTDDRELLRPHMSLKLLLCPLSGRIDLEQKALLADHILANYDLWFGFYYQGYRGMNRLGDRMEFLDTVTDPNVAAMHRFRLLASDEDVSGPGTAYSEGTHPDDAGVRPFRRWQNEKYDGNIMFQALPAYIGSRWEARGTHLRGLVDLNFAYDDGSVERHSGVKWDDDRMAKVRVTSSDTFYGQAWQHLPKSP